MKKRKQMENHIQSASQLHCVPWCFSEWHFDHNSDFQEKEFFPSKIPGMIILTFLEDTVKDFLEGSWISFGKGSVSFHKTSACPLLITAGNSFSFLFFWLHKKAIHISSQTVDTASWSDLFCKSNNTGWIALCEKMIVHHSSCPCQQVEGTQPQMESDVQKQLSIEPNVNNVCVCDWLIDWLGYQGFEEEEKRSCSDLRPERW